MTIVPTSKRVHAIPQVTIKEDFVVQAPGHLIDIAIANKLTSVEWSLWMYLMRVNPFADITFDGEPIYRDIPSPSELAVLLGRDRKTIERAGRRLSELGLYKVRAKSWEGFNQTAAESKRLLQHRKNKKTDTELASPNQDKLIPDRTKKSLDRTKKSQKELTSPNQEAEPLQDSASGLSQTLQISTELTDSVEEDLDIAVATIQQLVAVVPATNWDRNNAIEEVVAIAHSCGYYPTQTQRDQLIEFNEAQFAVVLKNLDVLKRHSTVQKSKRFDHALRMGKYA